MTSEHYMKQPRSMLCRKLERHYIEENNPTTDERDFDYNFLPHCFRHIGYQPSPILSISLPWMI